MQLTHSGQASPSSAPSATTCPCCALTWAFRHPTKRSASFRHRRAAFTFCARFLRQLQRKLNFSCQFFQHGKRRPVHPSRPPCSPEASPHHARFWRCLRMCPRLHQTKKYDTSLLKPINPHLKEGSINKDYGKKSSTATTLLHSNIKMQKLAGQLPIYKNEMNHQ